MRTSSREWSCAVYVMTAGLLLTMDGRASAQEAASVQPSKLFVTLFEPPPVATMATFPLRAERRPALAAMPGGLLAVPPLPPATRTTKPSTPGSRLLPALYGSFGVLQALDAHSTLRAVREGHREANPVVAPLADDAGAMVALKAATTVGTIYLAHRLGRRHRVAALVLMIAVNGAYAAIVASNYGRGTAAEATR